MDAESEEREVDNEYALYLADQEAKVQRIVWAIAGIFVFTAVFVSIKLIRSHLQHFTKPIIQSKVKQTWVCDRLSAPQECHVTLPFTLAFLDRGHLVDGSYLRH